MDIPTIARQIARDAMREPSVRDKKTPTDPRDTLTKWEREMLVPPSVRLDLPIRDAAEIKAHMMLIKRAADRIIATCDAAVKGDIPERSAQMASRSEWRALHKQLNANPTRRPD